MSDSVQPHGLQLARLLCPWGSPGKNTGVGCHALLQGIMHPMYIYMSLGTHTHVHIYVSLSTHTHTQTNPEASQDKTLFLYAMHKIFYSLLFPF